MHIICALENWYLFKINKSGFINQVESITWSKSIGLSIFDTFDDSGTRRLWTSWAASFSLCRPMLCMESACSLWLDVITLLLFFFTRFSGDDSGGNRGTTDCCCITLLISGIVVATRIFDVPLTDVVDPSGNPTLTMECPSDDGFADSVKDFSVVWLARRLLTMPGLSSLGTVLSLYETWDEDGKNNRLFKLNKIGVLTLDRYYAV